MVRRFRLSVFKLKMNPNNKTPIGAVAKPMVPSTLNTRPKRIGGSCF